MENIIVIFCVIAIVLLGLILALWLNKISVFWLAVVVAFAVGFNFYVLPQEEVKKVPEIAKMVNPTVIQIVPPTRFDNASVLLRDTLRGRFVFKRVSIPDSCYDTLGINQKLNYAEFQQKLDDEEKVKKEAADTLNEKITKITVGLGVLLVVGLIMRHIFLE